MVGIGASAGGLKALKAFFEPMPRQSGMAFVVIMHLSPNHESTADAILQRSTSIPVTQVTGEVSIEADHIYLIPPSKHLLMEDGRLLLADLHRPPGVHLAIDLFFRSLGDAHRERAVAVILSGTGSDGSQGLRRIKEGGGVTLVQSPADAEHDVMPLNAMATGLADFVMPATEMARKLVELWANAQQIQLPDPPDDLRVRHANLNRERHAAHEAFHDVLALLLASTGHDFQRYKRATVLRRLERRMQVCRQATLPAYLDYMKANPSEARLLLQDMLISVTNFFRDRESFDALEAVLADMFGDGRESPQLRAWAAGCATGEEAYSLAILLHEQAVMRSPPIITQIFGTDLDERAISTARIGLFNDAVAADVTPQRLQQYFNFDAGQYRICKAIRERVTFSVHNLLRDPPFSRMDVVCCRNLLIYLGRDAQRQVLEIFHYALNPGGVLMLGASETAEVADDLFVVLDKKHRLYRPVSGGGSPRRLLSNAARELQSLNASALVAPGREKLLADIHHQLLDEYSPPTVLVDASGKILHSSSGASRFLVLRDGHGEQLGDAVLPPLRQGLRAALQQARQNNRSTEATRIHLTWQERQLNVNMVVRPLQHPQAGPHWMLVVFIEADSMPNAARDDAAAEGGPSQAGERLQAGQLLQARRDLQRSVGRSQTSAEELRAANEELQSLNEELRSATEELETSKEELQSVNEELTTVNYELKSRVEETAKTNDDLKNLIAANDIATVFVDADLRIKRFTPRASAVFNIISSDSGRSLLDITHRLDYPDLAGDAREVFTNLRTIEREVHAADGRWYLVRLLPYRTLENRIEGAVLNFIDVSERRVAEERLRAGEARIRLVAETTQDFAIITLDTAGVMTSWNKGAETMFGYFEREAIGQHCSLIFTVNDRQHGVPDDEMRRAREQGRALDERWHLRKDGTQLYCSGVMTALPGQGEGFAKIARDLTATKRIQEQREALLQSEKSLRLQLEAANLKKDEFLAVMSHELKNPLNLIALNADLLRRLPESREIAAVVRIAETISTSVSSQAQIINDLLDLSRMQTGKLSLSRRRVVWNEIVRRIVDAIAIDANAKNLQLNVNLSEQQCSVWADPVRLEQIVWNLFSNAMKFTPAGGAIDVTLTVEDSSARLVVADTGEGIEKGFMSSMFDMFSQADSGVARREGGLGIGLALTKRLVDLHDGKLEVDSQGRGMGSSFTVVLPCMGAESLRGPATRDAGALLTGLKLLLVDDMPDTLETFAMLLQLEGARAVVAGSGEQALEQVKSQRFDLIISDLAMPGMDGFALLKRLRAAGNRTPAVAVSGIGVTGNRNRALEAGFEEMLSKPVDLDILVGVITRLRER